jgi:hypothetical protein
VWVGIDLWNGMRRSSYTVFINLLVPVSIMVVVGLSTKKTMYLNLRIYSGLEMLIIYRR